MTDEKVIDTTEDNDKASVPGTDALLQFMKNAKASKEENMESSVQEPVETVTEKSPLEQLREKQESEGTGMQIDKTVYEEQEKAPELRNPIENDSRLKEFQERLKADDEKLVKRKALVLIKRPSTPADYVQIEYEIDGLQFDENGKPYWDLKDTNALGETITIQPQWFVIRTEEYGEYDPKTEALYSLGKSVADVKAMKETGTLEKNLDEEYEEPVEKIESEKKLVQILIDKTGYGNAKIEFTPDEKKTIYEADQILITSTKKLDLASIKINERDADAPRKSFQETAREHQLSDSHATVCFPVSGFHAQMTGMSYGELCDVALDPETLAFDNVRKQISVVYNKMKNVSCNAFADIDDFMKHFAWSDFNVALYGLLVATFPEIQTIGLTCGRQSCRKAFEHTYNTRSIMLFNQCPDAWLTKYKELVAASPYDYETLAKNAPVNNISYIQLPKSGFIVGLGPVTLYDYLYKLVSINDEQAFRRVFGDNPSNSTLQNISIAPFVRGVFVPDGKGGYDQYEELKDVIDALSDIAIDESKIVRSLAADIRSKMDPVFGVENVICPHCGAKTKFINLDIGNLLFQAREMLENTTVDVSKWRPM